MINEMNVKLRGRKGFSLIELIVVIAIVGILVIMTTSRFLSYTKNADVATMKADVKVLSDAAILYNIEKDSIWPIGEEIVKSEELEAIIGEIAVYEIDEEALAPFVKNIKGEYSDYGIIITGEMEGEVIHLLGVKSKDETVWFGTTLNSDSLPIGEHVDYAACATGVYLATDDDFDGDADGEFYYIGTETEVRIPHVIKGIPVTDYSWMFYATEVTKVVSDNPNIVSMEGMFDSTRGTSLDLSCFDTSSVASMSYMFNYSEAETLNLSNWDTSAVTDMSYMFSSSLMNALDLSNLDTSAVTTMEGMFYDSLATTIDFDNFETSNVVNMNHTFFHSLVEELDLSNFDTQNVTDMGGMFRDSESLSIDLSSFDTSKVTSMSYMFCNAKTLSLDLSDWDTSMVTDMDFMFANSQVSILDLGSFDTLRVVNMRNMFDSSRTTTLNLSSFATPNVTSMAYMFANTFATALDLSSFDTANVTDVSYMFSESLASIGFARTQAEADRFNATENIPEELNFIPKP